MNCAPEYEDVQCQLKPELHLNFFFILTLGHCFHCFFFFFKREREEERRGEREISVGERSIDLLPLVHAQTRDPTYNLLMLQPIEPHQPGQGFCFGFLTNH